MIRENGVSEPREEDEARYVYSKQKLYVVHC